MIESLAQPLAQAPAAALVAVDPATSSPYLDPSGQAYTNPSGEVYLSP